MAAEAKNSEGVDDNDCRSEHVQEPNVETITSTDAYKQQEDVNHPLVQNTHG